MNVKPAPAPAPAPVPVPAPPTATPPVNLIGLDLGKRQASVCEWDRATAKPRKEYDIPVSRPDLQRWAQTQPVPSRIIIETSGNAYEVYRILTQAGHEVVIANPMLTKAIAWSSTKTNKVDARTLPQLDHAGVLPKVWAPDLQTHRMRLLCQHRGSLVKTQTKYKNTVQSILTRNLVTLPSKEQEDHFSDLFGQAGRQWLKQQIPELPVEDQLQMQTSLALLDTAQQQIAVVEKELANRAYDAQSPWAQPVKLLVTIPGVDVCAALSLLSAIGDISRFPSAGQLSGYFGVVSRVYNTGDTWHYGPITKRGNPMARWILVQCAQAMVKADGVMKRVFEKIKHKKGRNVAIVAVARKLTVLIWHILTKKTAYWYERPMLTQNKLAKMRILATGKRLKRGPRGKNEPPREPSAVGGSNYRKSNNQNQEEPHTHTDTAAAAAGAPPHPDQSPQPFSGNADGDRSPTTVAAARNAAPLGNGAFPREGLQARSKRPRPQGEPDLQGNARRDEPESLGKDNRRGSGKRARLKGGEKQNSLKRNAKLDSVT
jgi:transposase